MGTAEVWVFARDTVPIPTYAYGVNNDWRRVPMGEFSTFITTLKSIQCTLLRFPGGFESEWYDWFKNSTPGWPKAPEDPGATPATALKDAPAVSMVLKTSDYTKWKPSDAKTLEETKTQLGDDAEYLVKKFKGQVKIWEIGNEWFNHWGPDPEPEHRKELFERYVKIAPYLAERVKLAARDVDSAPGPVDVDVYVNGDWVYPYEFTWMKDKFGESWKDVDGVALHIYAGDVDGDHHFSHVIDRITRVKERTGLSKVYVSEWNASRRYTGWKINLQAANAQMELMWLMLRGGITGAAIWASAPGRDPVPEAQPGLDLVDATFQQPTPTGQGFWWMAAHMTGLAVSTSSKIIAELQDQIIPERCKKIQAVAARDGNRLVVFLLGYDRGAHDVIVHVAGFTVTNIVSARVLYSPTPDADVQAQVADITASVQTNPVKVTINPGGAGRGSSYEIIRLIMDGVVATD